MLSATIQIWGTIWGWHFRTAFVAYRNATNFTETDSCAHKISLPVCVTASRFISWVTVMAESNSYYIWKNKCALKVIKACWFMNNTPFYYYLQSIMRQATKLTMNALLCDCQLFYKILNRFIYSIIMCIIKLLLFNKLISPVSPEPRFEIWLRA